MNLARKLVLAALLSVVAWVSVALVVAQNVHVDSGPFFRFGGAQIVRFWDDFVLRPGESSRDILVVGGATTIAGYVDGDVVAILGPVRLESTAEIRGSLVSVGGNTTVLEGASVHRDFVVVGGSSALPVSFYPGGEHVVIGSAWMADRLRALVPWITHGLLWGRLIVPSVGWIWPFVGFALILTLAVNLLLDGAVGRSAETLATRPASAFVTGLLMLLLTGPVAVLLAATVIGLAIVPFLLCAVVVAWITGKVAVARWMGRSVLGHDLEETRLRGMAAVLVGFMGICLLYMVPIAGLLTWALVGVFGLGSATLTVLSALRRERARAVPPAASEPSVAAADGPPAQPGSPLPAQPAWLSYVATGPARGPQPGSLSEPPSPPPAGGPGGAGLALMPHASFVERLAAAALDVMLVLVVFNVFFDNLFWPRRDGNAQMFVLFAYFVTFWAWKGTTLGGIVCNLRVTRVDGAPLTGADAIVRGLASIFSFLPLGLGFFWILRDPLQQAWHDRIAGTYVVRVPREFPL